MDKVENRIWEILGIEKTKDERAVTQAYRDRLSVTNPEDKPEEFKELRNAYEEALAYARTPETIQGDNEEVEQWLKDLQDLYADFSKRKETECWEELFSREICASISGHMRIEEELLRFLMDHFFIGHDVWLCMDRHFSFLERKEDLYQNYPRDFIDRIIINGILYPDILPMTLFQPGKDGEECEKYLDTYLQIRMEEEARESIEKLQGMKESHPYGDAMICSWKIRFEDPGCLKELEQIAERYEDDLKIANQKLAELQKYYERMETNLSAEKQAAENIARLSLREANDIIATAHKNADMIVKQALITARELLTELSKLYNNADTVKADARQKLEKLLHDLEDFELPKMPDLAWLKAAEKKMQ